MGNVTNTEEIMSLLEKVKKLISGKKFDFVPRRKNLQSLAKHGLTIKDAKDEILDLVTSNYYKGPKNDFDSPGEIWEFKKEIDGTLFYIKIKIAIECGTEIVKCIGFHDDDFA